jgi:subtilisin family serine protease
LSAIHLENGPLDDRNIGIPPDHFVDTSLVFPLSDDLPSGAWHITESIRELHRRGIDGRGVKVAVNDTAGEARHPFLPKQIAGRDFTGSRNGLRDVQGHGSHCQGIVIAVAPAVQLITAKVLGDNGSGSTTGINAGRVWAAEQGADVISESLGDGGGPPIAADLAAFDRAYSLGVSICNAAAGNSGFNGASTIGRPASYWNHNNAITALQRDWRTIAGFSSGGPQARFAAPGAEIISCKPGAGWVSMNGTSMACPYKSAVDALVIGWRRSIGLSDLRGAKAWSDFYVENNLTVDLGSPGWDPRYGNGLVDLQKVFAFLLDRSSV